MRKEKLEQIKRMLYLENKIQEISNKYPESKNFDKEKKLKFYSKNITLLENEQLSIEDFEYFNVACIIPLVEIQVELSKYDNSSPKMDELKFIEDLIKKYNVNKEIICVRIKQVRKINKIQKQEFTVLAVPCDRAFVVAPDKVEEFKNSTNSKKDIDFVKKVAETFKRNNLVEDKPKVKKLGQKTDKK